MANQTNIQPAELTPNWANRGKSFTNLLHMGHCAPTVMQTLLDLSSIKGEWLVRLSAGMPGGIGNTGFECGALTSPLVMMGLRDGLRQLDGGLPVIFDRGHAHKRQFLACHKTLNCKQIRGNDRFPAHCIPPVVRSPEIYWHILDGQDGEAIPQEERASYARLYAHLAAHEFHCAQAVLLHLGYTPAADPELFDAVSAFIGGTLFLGKTCSAFTAGVMAAGLKIGEIENSIPRVVRLLAIMTANGNAFDDSLNKFNHRMSVLRPGGCGQLHRQRSPGALPADRRKCCRKSSADAGGRQTAPRADPLNPRDSNRCTQNAKFPVRGTGHHIRFPCQPGVRAAA